MTRAAHALLLSVLIGGCNASSDARRSLDETSAAGVPPDVVLVMTDDQGWGDLGLRGDPAVHTPHLDALFREGVELRRFYAAAPVCSPTRASVLTGRHPARMGIDGANDGHLPHAETQLAELLRARGYRTGFFGKWHLGTLTREVRDSNRGGRAQHTAHHSPPWEHGFDTVFATEAKVPTFDPHWKPGTREPYGTAYWTGPGEVVSAGELEGDDSAVIVREARRFLEASPGRDGPALAVVWLHAPHEPVNHPTARAESDATEDGDDARRRYLACLAALDEQVGALRETAARRPTVLIFCSDNGPEHASGPGSTGGLRGRKRDLLEGGVRVPAAIWWSESEGNTFQGLSRGQTFDEPTCTVDVLPTVLDIAGVTWQSVAPLDGASLLPRLRGDEGAAAPDYGFRSQRRRAYVRGRWKVHSTDRGATWQLFDVEADPGESTDVSASSAALKVELVAAFEVWEADVLADRADAPEASR